MDSHNSVSSQGEVGEQHQQQQREDQPSQALQGSTRTAPLGMDATALEPSASSNMAGSSVGLNAERPSPELAAPMAAASASTAARGPDASASAPSSSSAAAAAAAAAPAATDEAAFQEGSEAEARPIDGEDVSMEDLPDEAGSPKKRRKSKTKAEAKGLAGSSKKAQGKKAIAKPRVPQLPLERYQESSGAESFIDVVEAWDSLPKETRAEFMQKADEERQRFETEYETWRLDRLNTAGKLEKTVESVLAAKETALQRKVSRALKELKHRNAKQSRAEAQALPAAAKSAYALFCKDFCEKRKAASSSEPPQASEAPAAAEAAGDAAADGPDEAGDAASKKKRGSRSLKEMREAWVNLSPEEHERFAKLAAAEEARFKAELEAFMAKHPNAKMPGLQAKKRQRLSKVPSQVFVRPQTDMSNLLKLAHDRGLEERRETLKRRRMLGGDDDEGDPDLSALPAPDGHGNPGAGAGNQNQASVDDLLGGLLDDGDASAAGDGWGQGGGSSSSWFNGGNNAARHDGAIVPYGSLQQGGPGPAFGGLFSGKGQASAAKDPAVLGPRLRIDESGNIIVDEKTLSFGPDTSFDEDAPPTREENVAHYKEAYQRTSRSKWTDQETEDFYEALRIYGTDLFLVQTFFRNKSAAQIKQKYSKEVKRNPNKVNLALTVEARRLTRNAFESLHGKIDTEQHFKPPPSPLPGEEEPDGSLPGSFLHQPAPEAPSLPEPEFSVEDESHTTNRLMALFE